jgi:hypothetical protein
MLFVTLFEKSNQVQGPFSAREMIRWVSSGMLLEETRMRGADAKLGVSCHAVCYIGCLLVTLTLTAVIRRSARVMVGWVSSGMLLEETRIAARTASSGVVMLLRWYVLPNACMQN